jgi:hypothetical protein
MARTPNTEIRQAIGLPVMMADTEICPVIKLLVMMTDTRIRLEPRLPMPDLVLGPTGLNEFHGKWTSRRYPGISLSEEG